MNTWGKCQVLDQFTVSVPTSILNASETWDALMCALKQKRSHKREEANSSTQRTQKKARSRFCNMSPWLTQATRFISYEKGWSFRWFPPQSPKDYKCSSLSLTAGHDLKPKLVTESRCSQTLLPPSWTEVWVCARRYPNCCLILLESLFFLWQSFAQILSL